VFRCTIYLDRVPTVVLPVPIKWKRLSIQEPDPKLLKAVGAFALSQISFQGGFTKVTRNNR